MPGCLENWSKMVFNCFRSFKLRMESFDEHTKGILREEKIRDLHQLLDGVGFSHNALRLHLNDLKRAG